MDEVIDDDDSREGFQREQENERERERETRRTTTNGIEVDHAQG